MVGQEAHTEEAIIRGKAHTYHVIGALAAGGMGTTYVVYDHRMGPMRRFVIKVLHATLAREDPMAREHFEHEARAMAALKHPNVVDVMYLDELADGTPLYAMELLNGETVASRIAHDQKVHPLEAVNIAFDVVEGLHHAHKHGIVHQDIKPSNVVLHIEPTGDVKAKLIDFGVMRLSDDVRGPFAGTIKYAAPEQFMGAEVGPAADLFGVGGMLYEMLAGVHPFSSFGKGIEGAIARLHASPASIATHVELPPELVMLVDSMLSPTIAERPANARAVSNVLKVTARNLAAALGDRPAVQHVSEVGTPMTRAGLGALTDPVSRSFSAFMAEVSLSTPPPGGIGQSITLPRNFAEAHPALATAVTERQVRRASVTEPMAPALRAPVVANDSISTVITDPSPLVVPASLRHSQTPPQYVSPVSEQRPLAPRESRAKQTGTIAMLEEHVSQASPKPKRVESGSPVRSPSEPPKRAVKSSNDAWLKLVFFCLTLVVVVTFGLRIAVGMWPWATMAGGHP